MQLIPSVAASTAIASLRTASFDVGGPRVALPMPEIQIVARIGAAAEHGVDVHALGVRETVHRKHIAGGQRSVSARLKLGAQRALFGVPATALAGRIVALEDLWDPGSARDLRERIARAPDLEAAAATLDAAIAARLRRAPAPDAHARLGLRAAERLAYTPVHQVAAELRVSERHLRRVVRETIGLSPKGLAKLSRFHRALAAAREPHRATWASIASAAGYYDQAHLIAEFRAIAGVTPRVLLDELHGAARPARAPLQAYAVAI